MLYNIWEKLLHTWNLSLYSVGVDGEHDLLEVPPELVAEGGLLAVELRGLLLEAYHQGRVLPFNFEKKVLMVISPENVLFKTT